MKRTVSYRLGDRWVRGAFTIDADGGMVCVETARLTEWCTPELAGGRVKKWHLSNQERALHSVGARKVRGLGVAMDDSDGSATEPGTISRPPGDGR